MIDTQWRRMQIGQKLFIGCIKEPPDNGWRCHFLAREPRRRANKSCKEISMKICCAARHSDRSAHTHVHTHTHTNTHTHTHTHTHVHTHTHTHIHTHTHTHSSVAGPRRFIGLLANLSDSILRSRRFNQKLSTCLNVIFLHCQS